MSSGTAGFLRDVVHYLIERRKFLLAPLLILLLLMALFAVGFEIPVLTPFLYALF